MSEKIIHINKILKSIRNINQLITKEKDINRLLSGVCKNFIEIQGYETVWIALFDDSKKLIKIKQAGFDKDFSIIVKQLKKGEFPNCVKKILQSKIVLTDDLLGCENCIIKDKYKNMKRMNARLKYKKNIYGILSVSYSEIPDEKELNLFKEVANDIAFALYNIELEKKQKEIEKRENFSKKLLEQLNKSVKKLDLIKNITRLIKEFLGIEAVGIRLKEGYDFPYYYTEGFENHFIEAEKYLCTKNILGNILKDKSGRPYLVCLCGNILSGRTNPNLPFFTKYGSFWTNSTTELLASNARVFLSPTIRNRCNSEGYESLALIPIKTTNKILGLLQLNDKRKNFFTPNLIKFLEELAINISFSLNRFEQEEETKLFKTISDSINYGIGITDMEFDFIYTNQNYIQMFGYDSPDELIGKNIIEFYHDTEIEKLNILKERLGKGYKIENEEIYRKRKDNSIFLGLINAVTVKDENDIPLYTIETVIDITNRKKEEELKKEKEIAEKANIAKSEFLSNISHEMRNHLNSIIGIIELLSSTSLNNIQREHIEILKTSGDNLLNLINDILDLSKIEAGKLELININFKLREVIENIYKITSVKAKDKKLEIKYYISPDIPETLIGDPNRLSQILINLIGNAIKFTKEGGITVNCQLSSDYSLQITDYPSQLTVLFSVSDTGIGIPENQLNNIFEQFVQLDSPINQTYKGSGLGLTIVKKLVNLMGGDIKVESKLGVGTTFYFSIKFKSDHSSFSQNIEHTSQINHHIQQHFIIQPINILLVEDDKSNRTIIKNYLENTNCKIEEATNGKEAFEKFISSKYDLVIMDIEIPVMDGYNTTKAIRKWEQEMNLNSTPILALTGHVFEEDIEKSYKSGCSAHLNKPIKKEDLIKSISFYCKIPLVFTTLNKKNDRLESKKEKREDLLHQILIVDDDEINRLIFQNFLSSIPYKIDFAENGLQAFEKFKSNKYDLVFMDVQMPIMNGYNATKSIRKWEEKMNLKQTPIIALTGMVSETNIKESGYTGYLEKPIKKEEFLNIIYKYIEYPIKNQNIHMKQNEYKDILEELKPKLFEDIHNNINIIKECLEKGDFDCIAKILHKIKGSVSFYKFDKILDIITSIEKIKDKNPEKIKKYLNKILNIIQTENSR